MEASNAPKRARDLSLNEQAGNDARKFRRTKAKNALTQIKQLLNMYPSSRPLVLEFMLENEWSFAGNAEVLPDTVQSAAEKRKKEVKKESKAKGSKEDADEESKPKVERDIPTVYSTMGGKSGLSVELLAERMLPMLEKFSLSSNNLKGCFKAGWKKGEKLELLNQVQEFATGLPPDFRLKHVQFNFKLLAERMKFEYELRGSRCSQLELPPDWAKSGLFLVEVQDKKIIVSQQYTDEQEEFSIDVLAPVVEGEIVVDANWSESQASLMIASEAWTGTAFKLAPHFSVAGGSASADGGEEEQWDEQEPWSDPDDEDTWCEPK